MLMCALRRGGFGNGAQSDQKAHGKHSTGKHSTHWLCSAVPSN
jgi:hypothetical protein